MVRSKFAASLATSVIAGLLCIQSVVTAIPHASNVDHRKANELARRADDDSWTAFIHREASSRNPAHQNPQVAPALPIQQISTDIMTAQLSTNASLFDLSKRDDGPLLCSLDTPCPDGSCCARNNTCGYGPEFCGDGCSSQCNATAMCGRFSEDASVSCGMHLCCSATGWCGTTDLYCVNGDAKWHTLPCQDKYGACAITAPPSCGQGSGTTKGRTIGYYQASNTRDRLCNKITPSQIQLNGYTHLYFAFASIDPGSFSIVPADPLDVPIMSEFTALRSKGVQTWIAVGGYDFSDENKATHRTWSQLCASPANRAAFIASLKPFMTKYGFQGVDIDWEYPVEPKRGGAKGDTENLVALVREMRAAFGSEFGISLTLAPDYWYLRYFDAKGMEPYVDWFGFMAYDLHGSWDTDVKTLGSIVRGQADIREISNDTLPLWFDKLNPSKINFGLANYGRGYTLTDPSCNHLLCPFKGPSKKGKCTNFDGVLSRIEIEGIITDKGLTPQYLPDSMMKQLTWDDQWIGYDDAETHAAKKAWADGQCFGGTMVWSVDFYSGIGSGLTPEGANTTDGTCGASHNNTVCGNWPGGNCCSAGGWCGNTQAHCGNGCQSGDCKEGGVTSDGSCGAQNNNMVCGGWSTGSCCSSSGFCGSGDAYCGAGCQSGSCCDGKGSGDVYPGPDFWSSASPVASCFPPCTIHWPPLTLQQPLTVSWPPITTSLWSLSGSVSVLKTTTITLPVFTTSVVSFWPVTVGSSDPVRTSVTPVQSIVPPLTTLVVDNTLISITETIIVSGSTTNYTILPPFQTSIGGGIVTTITSGGKTITTTLPPAQTGVVTTITSGGKTITTTLPPGITFPPPGSTTITIQPPPTHSISFPDPPIPHFTQSPPDPRGCKSNCGDPDCRFGCNGHCGLFGCEQCGIFGCGGGGHCGLGGCPAPCPFFGCPGGTGGGGGGGGNPPPPGGCQGNNCPCDSQKTVIKSCGVDCPATVVPWTTTVKTDDCATSCATTPTSCGGTETTSTKTSTSTITYPGPCTAGDIDPFFVQDAGAKMVTEVWSYIGSVYGSTSTTTTTSEPPPPPPKPTPTVSYDCKGSGLCGGALLKVKYCDHAVNSLRRGESPAFIYTTEDPYLDGNCWADSAGDGCGVFVAGTPDPTYTDAKYCTISADDMWWAYQDIRKVGDCDKCGSKHFGDGCRVTVNYVTGCDNH